MPYMPELPRPFEAIINYNHSVYKIHGIHTTPAGLESTCLVLCYGLGTCCLNLFQCVVVFQRYLSYFYTTNFVSRHRKRRSQACQLNWNLFQIDYSVTPMLNRRPISYEHQGPRPLATVHVFRMVIMSL